MSVAGSGVAAGVDDFGPDAGSTTVATADGRATAATGERLMPTLGIVTVATVPFDAWLDGMLTNAALPAELALKLKPPALPLLPKKSDEYEFEPRNAAANGLLCKTWLVARALPPAEHTGPLAENAAL